MMETIHCYFLSCGDFDFIAVLHLTETFTILLLPAMKHGSEISSVVSTDSILFPDIHPSVL